DAPPPAARLPRLNVLLVFVKEPRPGAAKTRLVPVLGAERAAELYRLLAEEEIRRTAPARGEYERLFFFAPPEARLADWLSGETLLPQQGADLGARMAGAFDEAFRRGATRAAIVGTDVPFVSRDLVLEAFRALDDHDLVLGPAKDGGYYLLALGRPRPALFSDIAWSTASVLASTVDRAGGLGLSVRLLEPLRDIDTLEDVRAERVRLGPLLARSPGLAAAVAEALGPPGGPSDR
ncbi:MAG TPA: TIGR04282 family arsenosugar biosynthesis glycosyltransferase, partial [Vicinamibacteria bacterium]|nr:TIGR04282 family arsenosugar biosynthesis glycosyltransferase [Vicinamibacteria bacterium]